MRGHSRRCIGQGGSRLARLAIADRGPREASTAAYDSEVDRSSGDGPDGRLELLDDQRPADVALGVRAEQADVQVALAVQVVRVADGQGAGPAGGQVLDRQGVLPGRPAEGQPQVGAGREQADLVQVGVRAVGVVDQELGVHLGPVLAAA